MKTLSTSKERNGLEDIKYTSVVENTSQNNSGETQPAQGLKESDNLIICDSQLASSFQEVKISKNRLKPGHYLQKVFAHKLKSLSAPNLDKSKVINTSNVQDGDISQNSSLAEESESDIVCKQVLNENSNGWFKTWPECGLERPRNGVDLEVVSSNLGEDVCDNSLVICNPPVHIDCILENLPLAYSPITKQIHLINNNENFNKAVCSEKCAGIESGLHRVGTEVSSFSSTVSSLSDASPSTNGDSAVGSLFDPGDNCSLLSLGNCSIVSDDSGTSREKSKGLSGFLPRSVFGWKVKGDGSGDGWSLFGKGSETEGSRPSSGLSEEERRSAGGGSDAVLGSTGLIQLERPNGLPAKPKQEHRAHSQQHHKILQAVKKREQKEAKQRKRLLQIQLKAEDDLANATKIWLQEILPKWPQMRGHRKTLELWWQGVPPCVRGRLWRLAIGNDLNITQDLYDICLQRAAERLRSAQGSSETLDEASAVDRESSLELIQLDISRTFPHLCIFQKSGPYHEMLHSLLAAYACYRPDVGYVQGMSFIAAVLILNMEPPQAFVCFSNVLNRPCHRAFFTLDQSLMEGYYATYKDLLRENLPRLSEHLDTCHLSPDLYLLEWVYTVFAKSMNIDLASRIWDVFLRDGEEFIFRAAIGVMKLCEETLMTMDFVSGSQYLTKLPEDLCPNKLFAAIASVRMSIGKQTFSSILQSYTHTET